MITGMEMRFFTNVNTAENTQHSAAAIPAINSALSGKFSSVTMYPKEHPQNTAARSILFITSSGVTGFEQ